MGLSICYHLAARGRLEEVSQHMSDWQAQLRKQLPNCKISELAVTDKGVSFDLLPGPGTEIARMRLRHEGPDGSEVWAGSWDCKTQYAGCAQYGGPANFLEAHRSLITALDIGHSLGLVKSVSDDGCFWASRSIEKLLQRFHTYQNLVGSLAGRLRGAGFAVTSPVQDDPEFERRSSSPITPYAI